MNHRGVPLASRSFLFQPVGSKDVKSPGPLCCAGCYWFLLFKKKKQSGSLLKKLLFGGKSASTLDRKGVSSGRRRPWAVFPWSHLVVLCCKCGSWSCLPVGWAPLLSVSLPGEIASPAQGRDPSPWHYTRRLPTLIFLHCGSQGPTRLVLGLPPFSSYIQTDSSSSRSPRPFCCPWGPLHSLLSAEVAFL